MTTHYTEAWVMAAWDRMFAKTYATPAPLVRDDFLSELRLGGPARKKESMLFTKQDLLDVASTEHDKLMIHGIFAVFGTASANEPALMDKARKANMSGPMDIMIRLAKAKKEEHFEIGSTYRDADGRLYRYTAGGFRQYILLDVVIEPVRPLEKMP